MNTSSLALLVVMGVLAAVSVQGTEPASMGPFFSQSVSSIPQLVAQQETQRRYADIMLGLAQASQWQQYAAVETKKASLIKASPLEDAVDVQLEENNSAEDKNVENDDDDDDVSLLELKSEAPSPFSPFMAPFLGDNTNLAQLGLDELEAKSTAAKVSALKNLQIQLYLVSSDVEKTYWVNKILTPLLPQQMVYMKLYKQYLTTTALSIAYQLHDSFTLEAILDNLNDFHSTPQTEVSEARAEFHVYSQWNQLASIKLQLFFISIYEQSAMSRLQAMAAGSAFQSANSFLEVEEELKAEPFVGSSDMASTIQQYQFLTQYISFFRYYIMYAELNLASVGLHSAQSKLQGLDYKYDNKPENDAESYKLIKEGKKIEGKYLPSLYAQWAQMTTMKYYLEFSLFYLDMQAPQIALARAPQRAESSLQDLNLVQTEASTAN